MSFGTLVRTAIPPALRPPARRVYRSVRSVLHAVMRAPKHPYNLADLKADLQRAGIKPGAQVMVHSSLSRIGNVKGGAVTVIRSILETVTDSGAVLMPCYNWAGDVEAGMKEDRMVDLRTQPSETGRITEIFRTWPGVLRSSHPFSSVCAWGSQAMSFIAHHAEDPHICHRTSPVGVAVERNMTIMGIGIPIAQGLGVAHCLEDTWEGFPFNVYMPPFRVRYVDPAGDVVERDVVRLDPHIAQTRIDHVEGRWICARFTEHFKRVGLLREFRFGDAACWLMAAAPLYDELKRLAEKGITMYLTEADLDDRNRDVTRW